MDKELGMSDEDSYIIEESGSEYESESGSMNGTEDSDSDTEFDINNSSYNLPDVDIIPWSKVIEEENGHFEVDFHTATSGTKHINSCNKPGFVLKTVMEPHSYKYKQICKGPKPLTLERCRCKNNQGIHSYNFQYGLDKKMK